MADSAERIAEAVAHGLDSCCGDEYPLARIADCLEGLRQNGWRARDRHLVEVAILRALRRFADPASETGAAPEDWLAVDRPFCSTDRQVQELIDRRAALHSLECRVEERLASTDSRFRRHLA